MGKPYIADMRPKPVELKTGNRPVWQTDLVNPNFAEFAARCVGYGERLQTVEGREPGRICALAYPGPALLEMMTDPELV